MSAELSEQVRRLPLLERAQLWDDLWATLVADGYEPTLSDAQREELSLRVSEHQANPTDVVPWHEVQAELKARFGEDL